MKISTKYLFSSVFLTVFVLVVGFCLAPIAPAVADQALFDSQLGLEKIGDVAYGSATPQDIRITIAEIINVILTFLGVIFLGLTIAAGFMYMTSGGNEEKVKKAVGLLKNAIIGLVIILAAWAITRYSIIILSKTVNNAVDYRFYPK